MKKALLIILLLVFLISCKPAEERESVTLQEFRTGTEGLRINFVPNLPPSFLYDDEEFQAVIEIFNVGAYETGNPGDRIYLSGFEHRIISGIPTAGKKIPKITGKSRFNAQGGYDTVTFEGRIRKLLVDKTRQPIMATVCYDYETIAQTEVCIDPNPFAPATTPKVCTPQGISVGSQGAPVAVTRVDLEPSRRKTGFRITVQNVGKGTAFRNGPQYLEKCSPYTPKLGFADLDYVEVSDVLIGDQSVIATCKPIDKGHIRLTSGRGSFYCELVAKGESAYVTPITVILKYGYRDLTTRTLEIRQS